MSTDTSHGDLASNSCSEPISEVGQDITFCRVLIFDKRTTPHRRFKDSICEQFARLGKAISAPKRIELLDLLWQGPHTVEALAEQAAILVANASEHLQVLRGARLVDTEKKRLAPSAA